MKITPFVLFFSLFLSVDQVFGYLFTHVTNTPLFNSNLLQCNNHHVVLLKTTPFQKNETYLRNIYLLDFSPDVDMTQPRNLWKIGRGKKVPGKIRLLYLDACDLSKRLMPSDLENQTTWRSLETLLELDPQIYQKARDWDPWFHLYIHNCQNFGRYIQHRDNNPPGVPLHN